MAAVTKDNYADDLRLAHVIADQVDSITMSRFRALDLKVARCRGSAWLCPPCWAS